MCSVVRSSSSLVVAKRLRSATDVVTIADALHTTYVVHTETVQPKTNTAGGEKWCVTGLYGGRVLLLMMPTAGASTVVRAAFVK